MRSAPGQCPCYYSYESDEIPHPIVEDVDAQALRSKLRPYVEAASDRDALSLQADCGRPGPGLTHESSAHVLVAMDDTHSPCAHCPSRLREVGA